MQNPFDGNNQELDDQVYHKSGTEAWNLQVSVEIESFLDLTVSTDSESTSWSYWIYLLDLFKSYFYLFL